MSHSIGDNCQALVILSPNKHKGGSITGGIFQLLVLQHSPCGYLEGIHLSRHRKGFYLLVELNNRLPWSLPTDFSLSILLASLVHICVWVTDLSNFSVWCLKLIAEEYCQRCPLHFWCHNLLESDES